MPRIEDWTPEPWYAMPYEPGDRTVGIRPVPVRIEYDREEEFMQPVEIATFEEPVTQVVESQWSEYDFEERKRNLQGVYSSDYPAGYRQYGSALANAERSAACVNFCAGFTNEQLQAFGDLQKLINKFNLFMEGNS